MNLSAEGWRSVRVDWLMDEVRESLAPQQFAGREVFYYSIPAISEQGDGIIENGDLIASSKLRLRGGELLVSKLNPRKSHVLIARAPLDPTVCSGEFIVLRPRACDVRFMYYVFSSEAVRQQLSSKGQSVTKSHQRVDPNDITKLWVQVPSLNEQRAIADFLDRETARVDALIGRRRNLVRLVNLRKSALLSNLVLGRIGGFGKVIATGDSTIPELPVGWRAVRLRHVAREVTVGIVVRPSELYTDDGFPFIRGYNVRPGFVTDHDLARISPEDNVRNSKSILQARDVLVVRTGQAGAAAVVPGWAVGGNCVDVLIVRCGSTVRSKYVELVMNSEFSTRQIAALSVGAIQTHFNVGALRNLTLPLPPIEAQDRVIRSFGEEEEDMVRLIRSAEQQIHLLGERRRALIAALVTGNTSPSHKAA